jgi:putative endonuclease
MLPIAKGYRIMARRCKKPVSEIDIVARRRRDLDAAAEAVTKHGKRRIVAAAEFWLASHPGDAESLIRFDVILVAPGKVPRHVANPFDATH